MRKHVTLVLLRPASMSFLRASSPLVLASSHKPTVCLGITSAVVDTYGYGDGRIGPTHCALIAGALGDRCSRCRVCRTPRAAGGSVRSGLVAALRRVSIADPCGFHRSRTTPRSTTTPCGDANPAKWVGSGRVTLRHVSPIPPLDPCVRLSSHTAHERGNSTGNFHFTNST